MAPCSELIACSSGFSDFESEAGWRSVLWKPNGIALDLY
ncbi:unnamed protein product [Fusarium graminearum]|nr:unnamed protein product [Fusarium graminearum]VTO82033.1 unnamed protein product [Fusarium graminearum]